MSSSLVALKFSTDCFKKSQQLTTSILLFSILIFGSQDIMQIVFNSTAQDLFFTRQPRGSDYPHFLPCRNQGMSEWN